MLYISVKIIGTQNSVLQREQTLNEFFASTGIRLVNASGESPKMLISNIEFKWHIGEELPKISCKETIHTNGSITQREIVSLQADGDELELIKNSFTNIPIPMKKRVVKWFGEMAQFIFANL